MNKKNKLANKKQVPIQNRIFSLALPIYLKDNDEPIWLDRDDTLEVIHWTIDYIRNKPEYQISHTGILSHFYQSIANLEMFVDSKELIPNKLRKKIKLAFAPLYIQSSSIINLFNHYPKKINTEVGQARERTTWQDRTQPDGCRRGSGCGVANAPIFKFLGDSNTCKFWWKLCRK